MSERDIYSILIFRGVFIDGVIAVERHIPDYPGYGIALIMRKSKIIAVQSGYRHMCL